MQRLRPCDQDYRHAVKQERDSPRRVVTLRIDNPFLPPSGSSEIPSLRQTPSILSPRLRGNLPRRSPGVPLLFPCRGLSRVYGRTNEVFVFLFLRLEGSLTIVRTAVTGANCG